MIYTSILLCYCQLKKCMLVLLDYSSSIANLKNLCMVVLMVVRLVVKLKGMSDFKMMICLTFDL